VVDLWMRGIDSDNGRSEYRGSPTYRDVV